MGRVVSPTLDQIGSLRTSLTEGEMRLLDIFTRKLNDDWEIYTQPFLNGCRPDFVLIHPSAGIAVIEVKDWKNPKSLEDRWRKGQENPFHQIKRYAYEISTLYCPRMRSNRVGILVTGSLVL